MPNFNKNGNQWGFLFFYCHIGFCLTLFFSLSFTLASLLDSKLVMFHSEIKCWGMLIVTADGLHCSEEKEEKGEKNLKSIKDVQCTFCPGECESCFMAVIYCLITANQISSYWIACVHPLWLILLESLSWYEQPRPRKIESVWPTDGGPAAGMY